MRYHTTLYQTPNHTELLGELDLDNNPNVSFTEARSIINESFCLQELRKHSQLDQEFQQLKTLITNGFPNHRNQLSEACKRYCSIRDTPYFG